MNAQTLTQEINQIIIESDMGVQDELRKAFTKLVIKVLSPFQFQLYSFLLKQSSPMSAHQISEFFDSKPNYISNELSKLMSLGLVERQAVVEKVGRGLRYIWTARRF